MRMERLQGHMVAGKRTETFDGRPVVFHLPAIFLTEQ